MNFQKIDYERAAQIEEASNGSVVFEYVDEKPVSVKFKGPFGDIHVKVGSYSVEICEPKRVIRWVLTIDGEVSTFTDLEEAKVAFRDRSYEANKSITLICEEVVA